MATVAVCCDSFMKLRSVFLKLYVSLRRASMPPCLHAAHLAVSATYPATLYRWNTSASTSLQVGTHNQIPPTECKLYEGSQSLLNHRFWVTFDSAEYDRHSVNKEKSHRKPIPYGIWWIGSGARSESTAHLTFIAASRYFATNIWV